MGRLRSSIVAATVFVASFAAAALLTSSGGVAAEADKAERTVSVSATGWAIAEPDIAYISAGVVTESDAAKEAIARNNGIMAKVIDGLKGAGIAAKDIRTTTLNVQPRYTRPKDGRAPSISGYRVSNEVRLTVREVKRLGEVLDRAIALGANRIGQIAFDVADPEMLMDEARRRAMENARRRGVLYAKAAGAQLGPVLRISEGAVRPQPRAKAGTLGYAGVPIEGGTRRLQVEVHVVYALR